MSGYQRDKAVTRNHTREVIDIISLSEMISYHCKGLNCPIKQILSIATFDIGVQSFSARLKGYLHIWLNFSHRELNGLWNLWRLKNFGKELGTENHYNN